MTTSADRMLRLTCSSISKFDLTPFPFTGLALATRKLVSKIRRQMINFTDINKKEILPVSMKRD
jgi:hypothetical protein